MCGIVHGRATRRAFTEVRTMVQTEALVTEMGESGPFTRVILSVPEIARQLSPGRFVLAHLGGYLRTPLFPARLEDEAFEALIPADHPAAALRPEATVDLIGPLGHGFEVPTTARRLLLVADTPYLPVLLPLTGQKPGFSAGEAAESGFSVALLLSAPTATQLPPLWLLPPALEVHLVTADGSVGHHGSPLDLFPDLVRWADCTCITSDVATYPALAQIVREVRVRPGHRFAQALVVPPMACGVGACQGCAVLAARGTRLACTDGPVFDLLELR